MTTNSLFQANDTPTLDTDLDDSHDYYNELVGEGKKFKDEKALAKGKAHSDLLIEQLKRESQQARQELQTRLTMEDLVKQFKTASTAGNQPNQRDEEVPANNDETNTLRLDDLDRLLEEKLTAKELAKKRSENFNTVVSELSKAKGPTWANWLREQAERLDMDETFINQLASDKPKALLSLLGLRNEEGTQRRQSLFAPPQSSTASEKNYQTFNSQVKDWTYWEKLRKENPIKYQTTEIQREIFNSVKELGEDRFYKR